MLKNLVTGIGAMLQIPTHILKLSENRKYFSISNVILIKPFLNSIFHHDAHTLKQTQREKGRVSITRSMEKDVRSQPQTPIPPSSSSAQSLGYVIQHFRHQNRSLVLNLANQELVSESDQSIQNSFI